jgi:hypothetical protein
VFSLWIVAMELEVPASCLDNNYQCPILEWIVAMELEVPASTVAPNISLMSLLLIAGNQ